MMYLKQRDKDILNFIEDNGSITSQICANLFYQDCNKESAYIGASRRLKSMYNNKFLKRFRKTVNDEYIYYRDSKPLGYHQMKLLEVYSRLSMMGEIIDFKQKVQVGVIGKNKRENDGLIEIEIDQGEYINTYAVIIEIDYTHETSWAKIKDIISCGEYQNIYGRIPPLLIVKRYEHMKKLQSNEDITIVNLNWNLEGIEEVFK